jgi:hypothetical protein
VFRVAYDICGGAGSCIKAAHGAAEWAVERGLVAGAAELASGWCQQASSKSRGPDVAAAEGGGKLGVKRRRERG